MENAQGLTRQLGFVSATALVVANMVGTGIFTTSGFIIQELKNPQTMLICGFVGGLFALCGALCYGELAAMFPKAGGEYAFLKESLGTWPAFLSGWISLIVGFSAPIAAASIAFSTYFFRALPSLSGTGGSEVLLQLPFITFNPITLLAVGIILGLSFVHYHSIVLGSRVQNALTIFKVALIITFVCSGLSIGRGSAGSLMGSPDLTPLFSGNFAVSLIFVSFAYSGWNAAAYIGSEIKNPTKFIPLSLFCGTLLVMILYLMLNVVYVFAIPVEKMSGVLEVGATAAVSLFGSQVSMYFSGAIAMGILSVISAMIMTGPRVYYAMSKDRVFFPLFAGVSRGRKTPAYSIFLQAAIAVLITLTMTFDKLLIYIGFTLSIFTMLTVLGMIFLRIKKPSSDRPYRTFGYPITPVLFIAGNLWVIYFSIKSRPTTSLFGLGTILLGTLAYFYFKKKMGHSITRA